MSPEGASVCPEVADSLPPYAQTRLIAYLGNKRALLPSLLPLFRELDARQKITSFLDPFAGSGSVSRLARCLGWQVFACDQEEYSRAVNEAWLSVPAEVLDSLFARQGGLPQVLDWLNQLHPLMGNAEAPCAWEPYISRHYAPRFTQSADWRRERLFYTAENAVFIDKARFTIDAFWPDRKDIQLDRGDNPLQAAFFPVYERAVLLGMLIYEAATHANTSGVFKAYHKGFGGHGKDALGRILKPMQLTSPLLWPGNPALVRRSDAASFCRRHAADLCYLDPPYNQHQYGSNYHLLNTIAIWDRQEVSEERGPGGELVQAAGIPSRWRADRSAFCSRATVLDAFRELKDSIDAKSILLSYNTEGLARPEELAEIFSDRAEVSVRALDYVKYRGGRQSASRQSHNSELLFLIRRHGNSGCQTSTLQRELARLDADLALSRALSGAYDPVAFKGLCDTDGCLHFSQGEVLLSLRSFHGLVLNNPGDEPHRILDTEGKLALAALLENMKLPDNAAACAAAAALIEDGYSEARLQKLALSWLRKLAHRKYEADFRKLYARLAGETDERPEALAVLKKGLSELILIFEARIAGSRRYPEAKLPPEGRILAPAENLDIQQLSVLEVQSLGQRR